MMSVPHLTASYIHPESSKTLFAPKMAAGATAATQAAAHAATATAALSASAPATAIIIAGSIYDLPN